MRHLAFFAAALLAAPAAFAQTFPSRAVHIVTSEPGGGNDFAARVIAQPLSALLGQQVVIDNRGQISIELAAKDRKSTRLNSSHVSESRMPSSA